MHFLHFMQNFKMAAKYGSKMIFGKMCQLTAHIPGAKIFPGIALSWTVSVIIIFSVINFFVLHRIQDGCEKWHENEFWAKSGRQLCR